MQERNALLSQLKPQRNPCYNTTRSLFILEVQHAARILEWRVTQINPSKLLPPQSIRMRSTKLFPLLFATAVFSVAVNQPYEFRPENRFDKRQFGQCYYFVYITLDWE